jgi:histidine ammonia-lyase
MPQVHGICADTMDFVRRILQVELNSATDNPMLFADTKESISGGNFHGEYPVRLPHQFVCQEHSNIFSLNIVGESHGLFGYWSS